MALGDLIRLSSSFGVVFVSSVVILRTVLTRKLAFFVCWTMPLRFPLGTGPSIFFFSLPKKFFFCDSEQAGWIRPGLPPLRMMAGTIQHLRGAIWQAWRSKVPTDLCKRKGFRGGFGVDIHGSHQLLVSSHLRERDKMLLRAILSGGVWNGFLLGKAQKEDIPCRFCGAPDNDGHLIWDCTFSPFVQLRKSPEFLLLMSRASLSSLAWLASRADFPDYRYPLGYCI